MKSKELRVGLFVYKIIVWVGIVFFLFCAVMAWRAGQGYVSPLFLLFACIGVFLLFMASSIKSTSEYISVLSPFAEYRIYWDEVEWIEEGNQGTLVIHGKGEKRLVLPSPTYWSGPQKSEMFEFMDSQLENLEIEILETISADYKVHKNVKVYT
ncbi:hypothetical protein TSL6_07020 [Sulfurovum sp. TSL6]|uniref:hypothetical protein n=1 Tax=Sulfurovum sp. TSL6 TaxID=2826995 RepID=UPI001CC586E1|nr:hypothetical protein [Sulfurovum sp. TSL6]GIU00196.1 hypothetical protein TSL6_07020 [Sulfurovum sp. TSL6]